MNPTEMERHIRRLADAHCRAKHSSYYDSLVCVGGESPEPPCFNCVEEVRRAYMNKRAKYHGRKLSPEEAEKVRKKLGLP